VDEEPRNASQSSIFPNDSKVSPEDVARRFFEEFGELNFDEPAEQVDLGRKRRRQGVAVGLLIVLFAVGDVVAVIHHSPRSGRSSASHSGLSAAQAQVDRIDKKAGCPDNAPYVSDVKVGLDPSIQLKPGYLYSAHVRTTSGNFTVALNLLSANAVVKDFIYLAQSHYFHCVGEVTSSRSGLIGVNGAPTDVSSGSSAGSVVSVPQYSVVMVDSSNSSPLAARWVIVRAASGASLSQADVTFGRIVSEDGTLTTESGRAASVRDRVLSVHIGSAQG
jgi:hypothetical protein